MRSFNCKALTGKTLVFWIRGGHGGFDYILSRSHSVFSPARCFCTMRPFCAKDPLLINLNIEHFARDILR